jgi:two-component system, NarL family, sensor histidine kinase UhpB
LTNCMRHASARAVVVAVDSDHNGLRVSIADDGAGFDPARPREGLGLRGIEERVTELGGSLVIEAAEGRGTRLTICLPWAETSAAEVRVARAAG